MMTAQTLMVQLLTAPMTARVPMAMPQPTAQLPPWRVTSMAKVIHYPGLATILTPSTGRVAAELTIQQLDLRRSTVMPAITLAQPVAATNTAANAKLKFPKRLKTPPSRRLRP